MIFFFCHILRSEIKMEKIDWLSFTIPYDHEHGTILSSTSVMPLLQRLDKIVYDCIIGEGQTWELTGGRAPYAAQLSFNGVRILWGSPSTILIELTGQGCDYLHEQDTLTRLLRRIQGRTTRIDLAVDYVTETSPSEFVSKTSSQKQRSKSVIQSETGETCYVGSRKSARYCRVYRYHKPHPRADFLRVEFCVRKHDAKRAVGHILEHGIEQTISAFGQIFGFTHKVWGNRDLAPKLEAYRPERGKASTVRWLIVQAAPAFKQLVKDGIIEDPNEFIRQYFLDQ